MSTAFIFLFLFFAITLLVPVLVSLRVHTSSPRSAKWFSIIALIVGALPVPVFIVWYFLDIAFTYPSGSDYFSSLNFDSFLFFWVDFRQLIISFILLALAIKLALLPIWPWPIKSDVKASTVIVVAIGFFILFSLCLYYLFGSGIFIMNY